ncbi:MAG TPA: heavy metal-binding domain-containing protein [Oscillatoriaceae cyanobacterium]
MPFANGPYMAFPKKLRGIDKTALQNATYQVVPSERGVPQMQLELQFRRSPDTPVCFNPDMSLVVLLDRSGSMGETFRDGHAFNACAAILDAVSLAGQGYDLIFYDDHPTFHGPVKNRDELRKAIQANMPGGGTKVTEALRGAVKRYQHKRGVYLIVITDGEFADKQQCEQFVMKELLPKLTPDNPYAVRLHFIGAGAHVDREFLERIESLAAGAGAPLVTAHHHEHLSHSHVSMLDEMDRSLLGVSLQARFGDLAQPDQQSDGESVITRVGDVVSRKWHDGPVIDLKFVPRHAKLAFEYASSHPAVMHVGLGYTDPSARKHLLTLEVPMPQEGSPSKSIFGSLGALLHWPFGATPEQKAAREALKQQAEEIRKAELDRQEKDMRSLAKGGIPVQAELRLKELGAKADEGLFTSNLAPDEIALLRRNGYRARGLVTGSAMYHVGQAYASATGDCEVTVLSDAYNEATRLAVSRMQKELRLLGAHGVVGVRLQYLRHEWSEKSVEVQLVGTAIEGPGPAPKDPWMCDLSGQEWWALHRAGYEPAALVWGHCTWFILTTQDDEWAHQSWTNQEMGHWSQALSRARHLAMTKIHLQAKEVGASGVVGVHIDRRLDEVSLAGGDGGVYEREHHNLVMSIIGTAVKLRKDAPRAVQATGHVLSLRDGRLTSSRKQTLDLQLLD